MHGLSKGRKFGRTTGILVLTAVPVVIWLMLEGICAVSGVRPLTERADPFLGFSEWVRLFVVDDGTVRVRKPYREIVRTRRFPTPKPQGTTRVFAFGGSAAAGYPMGKEAAFSRWLEEGLRAQDSSRNFEVINLAVGSYGTYRIRQLVREAAAYEPDVCLLYVGNNEFLERRFYRGMMEMSRWVQGIRTVAGHSYLYSSLTDLFLGLKGEPPPPPDPFLIDPLANAPMDKDSDPVRVIEEKERILRFFQENLNDIISVCTEAGARVAICTVPVNLVGSGPTLSEPIVGKEVLKQAITLEGQDRFREAKELVSDLLKSNPDNALLLYHLGLCQYHLGQFQSSRKYLYRSLDHDLYPQRILPLMNRFIKGLDGNPDIAVCDLDRMFQDDRPGGLLGSEMFLDVMHLDVKAHQETALAIARSLYRSGFLAGRLDETAFRGAMNRVQLGEMWSKTASRMFFLGQTYMRQGNYTKAAEHFEQAVREESRLEYHSNLGIAYVELGQIEKAFEQFSKSVAMDPTDPKAHMNLGHVLGTLGHHGEALAAYREAVRLDPGLYAGYMSLSFTLRRLGRPEDAFDPLKKAMELDPKRTGAYHGHGLTYLQMGRMESAERWFRKSIEIDPTFLDGIIALSGALERQGKLEEASRLVEDAFETAPSYPALRLELGRVHMAQGRMAESAAHLEEAIRLSPGNPTGYLLLAMNHLNQGRKSQAIEVLKLGHSRTKDEQLREFLVELGN